jgi:hypothetical protein
MHGEKYQEDAPTEPSPSVIREKISVAKKAREKAEGGDKGKFFAKENGEKPNGFAETAAQTAEESGHLCRENCVLRPRFYT